MALLVLWYHWHNSIASMSLSWSYWHMIPSSADTRRQTITGEVSSKPCDLFKKNSITLSGLSAVEAVFLFYFYSADKEHRMKCGIGG